MPRDHLTPVN